MIRFIPLFILCFLPLTVFAQFDAGVAASYRTQPLGGAFDANVGLAAVLYGEPGDKNDPVYGYIRTELDGTLAPDYSGWGYQFQLFPISFLGVSAGQYFYDNQEDYSGYNCKVYLCIGTFREDFVEGRLALAYGPVFFIARLKSTLALESNSSSKTEYISPDYSLALDHDRDKVRKTTGMLGYDLDDTYSVIFNYIQSKAVDTEQTSSFYLGGVLFKNNDLKIGVLAGQFKSEHPGTKAPNSSPSEFTAMTSIQWNVLPSVALF